MDFEDLCINTLRFLAVDSVEKAKSGHPGAPMGQAAMAYVLWDKFLKHNPQDPSWPDRDRFILSSGHASALLYALLYLTGYDLTLEDIKSFRQWGSKTPGHPEYGLTPGVEATTGPLGQGLANAVGMAIAERWLASHYNKPGFDLIDHFTYAIVSDGDLMEGISHEAASLAGTLKLEKLIFLYDANQITIEGSTEFTFSEDVGLRFKAYGWEVIGPIDGLNPMEVTKAIEQARNNANRPSIIICRTIIGYGSPHKQGKASSHGEPLGKEEVLLAKKALGWPYPEPFTVPEEVLKHFRQAVKRGEEAQRKWQEKLKLYQKSYPEEAQSLNDALNGNLPECWDKGLSNIFDIQGLMATRDASGKVLNMVAPKIPYLIGGSADLAPSNKTYINGGGDFTPQDYYGRNLHFGVREHAMAAISNGLALHKGVIPYAGTFLVFSDYMRPAVRLAAMMKQQVIFIFTHDSIGLGEDGPTHQPVEQLMALRTIPNLTVIRPADAAETAIAWQMALKRQNGPTALILTRQKVPILNRNELAPADGVRRGGYILWKSRKNPEIIIIATGSEVHIGLKAARELDKAGIATSLVSLPSWEIFDQQEEEYRNLVLPPGVRCRISLEAGVTMGWERYIGQDGIAIGLDHFGASAPHEELYQHFGLTGERIFNEALKLIGQKKSD